MGLLVRFESWAPIGQNLPEPLGAGPDRKCSLGAVFSAATERNFGTPCSPLLFEAKQQRAAPFPKYSKRLRAPTPQLPE